MKKYLMTIAVLAMSTSFIACGGGGEEEVEETTADEVEVESNSNNPLDILNEGLNDMQKEINHQLSDPNSEFLEAIDTIKGVIQEEVVKEVVKEVKKKI